MSKYALYISSMKSAAFRVGALVDHAMYKYAAPYASYCLPLPSSSAGSTLISHS
jgi:hypothetical protein